MSSNYAHHIVTICILRIAIYIHSNLSTIYMEIQLYEIYRDPRTEIELILYSSKLNEAVELFNNQIGPEVQFRAYYSPRTFLYQRNFGAYTTHSSF